MTENTQEPPEFTAHADEMQWRGIYRDWALAGWQAAWTASRKQAMEEAAMVAEESTLRARQAKAWTNNQQMKPCEIAAAIRASASLRKEGKSDS